MPVIFIFILFLVLPILEIAVLIKVAGNVGVFYTLFFAIFTALLGAYLVRLQGSQTIAKLRTESQQGKMPAETALHGVMLLVAGVVLLTPGFITDILGFSLLIPAIRQVIIQKIQRHKNASSPTSSTRIIDGEVNKSE